MEDTCFRVWLSVKNIKNGRLGVEIQAPTKDGYFRRDLNFCI